MVCVTARGPPKPTPLPAAQPAGQMLNCLPEQEGQEALWARSPRVV